MEHSSYNFDPQDISDGDYHRLYSKRRRDAVFAFSIPQKDGSVILGRDHLGNVPLFYRVSENKVKSSIFLENLLAGDETISEEGLRVYLSIGTIKVSPLFNEISLVPPGTVLKISPNGNAERLYQYHITPALLENKSLVALVDTADHLLTQAAKRTLKQKRMGLYLSGGIDSTLTGIYLKKAGAEIHAYTAMPWGVLGSESGFALENARIIGATSHHTKPLSTNNYNSYIENSVTLYSNPVGTTSQMAISCLLNETSAGEEPQIYFAQNCDTAMCSVPDQSLIYFVQLLPQFIQSYLHKAMAHRQLSDKYTAFRTVGLLKKLPSFIPDLSSYRPLQQLSLVGMLFGHTPIDGDIVLLPAIKNGRLVSNLFYDMDVVEFALGIPFRHRVGWSHESKIGLSITKRVFKELASRHNIPRATIKRKKGLTVPVNRDTSSTAFFSSLPTHIRDIELTTPQQQLAAEVLTQWAKHLKQCPQSLKGLLANKHD